MNCYYGIDKGNALLSSIETFLNSIPEVAVYERILSDQFIFLVHRQKLTSKAYVKETYARHVNTFLNAQQPNYPDAHLKISCGIFPMTNDDILYAIDGANMARKEAKKQGSFGAVVFDDKILEQILIYHREEQNTNLALMEKRFVFFLQPKVNLLTGEIVGAEALARQVDTNGRIISPAVFMPIMEATGSIIELDIMIFEQVCAYLADRLAKELPVVRTSVNLSRLHIQNPNTTRRLRDIAHKYNIPPHVIEFELTETIFLRDFKDAKMLIDRLRGYQYHVSIDDFGSGYAGINIWQELNFDILKLDRKFLSDTEPAKSRNAAIVPNVINIAQRLGIEVLCEGVETKAQCEYLLQLGCTTVQGYYFSPPVPKETFYTIYTEQNGHYNCDFKAQQANAVDAERDNEEYIETTKDHKTLKHFLLLISGAVFLALCVVLTLNVYRSVVTHMFETSICNNLDSYTLGQRSSIDAKIARLTAELNSFALLIEERNDSAFINTYISVLQENNPEALFLFITADEFADRVAENNSNPTDIDYMNRMKSGEIVVSNITKSQMAGSRYCFSIGVPVFINDTFAGGLRAIVDADTLTDTSEYVSPYGTVKALFVVDENGALCLPNEQLQLDTNDNILDKFAAEYFSDSALSQLEAALKQGESVHSFKAGMVNQSPYYISVLDLGYGNWKQVALFQAQAAASIVDTILHYTIACSLVLMLAIAFISTILFISIQRWRKKVYSDAERYLLLEQFSDTVLFDYDCEKDIFRFTPNAKHLFHVHHCTYKNFLAKLATIQTIYPGDYSAVRDALSGHSTNEHSEVRIRLQHPSDLGYYWCLIQYKYIYQQEKLVSIIGKIVDIDAQQRRETQLIGQALRDGLTGLYNKSAAQNLVSRSLDSNKPGLLFMIDLDYFKQLNDTYGHSKGDCALKDVSECLKQTFRANDIIGRVGGDEFMVYMNCSSNPQVIHQKMSTFWNLLCICSKRYPQTLSVSIGIAFFAGGSSHEAFSFEALFQNADQAMYKAKQSGKQRYCFEEQCYLFE